MQGLKQSGIAWTARTTNASGDRISRTFRDGATQYHNHLFAIQWITNQRLLRAETLFGTQSPGSPVAKSPGHTIPPSKTNQSQLTIVCEEYLNSTTHLQPATLEQYKRCLGNIIGSASISCVAGLLIPQTNINQYADERKAEGAGRTIAKELGILRQALRHAGVTPAWSIPRWISRLTPLERPVPATREVQVLLGRLGPGAKLGVLLALLAGIRNEEAFRVTWDMIHLEDNLINIPARIRKVGPGNTVPLSGMLKDSLIGEPVGYEPIINVSKSMVLADLRRCSRDLRTTWYGLQPARRCLVTWAEDAGHSQDTISLVTGHARTSMVSRYSSGAGRLDLKRTVIEDVERRLAWQTN